MAPSAAAVDAAAAQAERNETKSLKVVRPLRLFTADDVKEASEADGKKERSKEKAARNRPGASAS